MLTNDLLRFEIDTQNIKPRYVSRKSARFYLGVAEDLIEVYQAHIGKKRYVLVDALNDYESDRMDYKILRGLIKMLEGYAEFQPLPALDYPELRRRLFEFAEAHRPVVKHADLLHRTVSETVLQKFREAGGPEIGDIYGDLTNNQVLRELVLTCSPEELLKRYNLALAQGILYRCFKMEIKIWDSYQMLFRYLKLAQLMHDIRLEECCYCINIDGPFSLFRKTQKYGVNLSRFLPALLLANRWSLIAQVNTVKGLRTFALDQHCGLTSHYKHGNPFDSSVEEAFYATFSKRKTEWKIEREGEILDLGDSVFIPDFKFVHPDGREMLLEIVGFWTPEYLQAKFKKVKRANCDNLFLAVNASLNCSADEFAGHVIHYKTRLKAGEVLKVLDGVSIS